MQENRKKSRVWKVKQSSGFYANLVLLLHWNKLDFKIPASLLGEIESDEKVSFSVVLHKRSTP